jgi:hypothetical protein
MCRRMFACLAFLLSLLLAAPALVAQGVAPEDKPFFEAYRRADPIIQWPLKKVLHHIPELRGLKPAADQSQLPEVLRRVSENLQRFVVSFVDVSALETIDETSTYGAVGELGRPPPQKTLTQKFRYLVLARREGGAFTLVEYRTDLRGREEHPKLQTLGLIKTTGFAGAPLFFGPLQQPWSSFRYLGRQAIGGINTEVVAFAEHPEPVAVMGHFMVGETSVPLLVQGVAWIRTSDYQILQMRTDLLAPLPPLPRVTAVVHFAENRFQDARTTLWLPKEVEVEVELGDYVFSNRHRYSNYQMFRVTVIQKQPPAAQQH